MRASAESGSSAAGAETGGLPPVARILLLVPLLYGFLVAIHLMSAAFKVMGGDAVQSGSMFTGIDNPFAGLAVGVLATVLVQSSSTTTSVIVSCVGSGILDLSVAVPMIMGANIGTTVTNTLVSIGHIGRSEDFRRAFAAATVHDFFNLIAVAVFLPLELMTHALSRAALRLTDLVGHSSGVEYKSPIKVAVKGAGKWVRSGLEGLGLEDTALAAALLVVGIVLTIACLLQITRHMRLAISGRLERIMNRLLGSSGLLAIAMGAGLTVLVQSSSVTTSLLVPMCAAGILPILHAFPVMLGANIGTTVTALLASLAVDSPAGLTIALVHLLFNGLGVLLIYPFPPLRRVPVRLAEGLARAAVRNRFWVAAYVVGVFVILPLIGWKLAS